MLKLHHYNFNINTFRNGNLNDNLALKSHMGGGHSRAPRVTYFPSNTRKHYFKTNKVHKMNSY